VSRRSALAAAALVAVLGGGSGGSAAPASPARIACSAGAHPTKLRGRPAVRFCGGANAVVHLGRSTLRFAGGGCSTFGTFFTVNIGTTVTDAAYKGRKPDYFGITAHRAKAGRQPNPAIAFTARGRSYALTGASVVLAKGLRGGNFRGTVFVAHTKVSGSFGC
jgi:hypothetical protein